MDFIWGAQYYRAPTPDRRYWRQDLANMKELGFTDIKYWVQWRWSHRDENEFYFDDLDELMDLANEFGLRVTLNTIFDVTPVWFLNKYPDSRQILTDGSEVKPYASACRQIGGMAGPCYNHEMGITERQKFMTEVVKRYASHPAMYMWDVWNEPEQCHKYRRPSDETLTCYCPSCKQKFSKWLSAKYGDISSLNEKWGRFYRSFDEIELPQNPQTFGDFIDFREFHLDTMTNEAKWRLDIVRKYDKNHKAYLHVVPNNSRIFNAVTGVDDFALSRECDVFASTNFAKPIWSILTCSAANGKPAYNVECHIGTGSTKMHPKHITLSDMVRDFAPQIGMGIRGFMFWQYHAERLGIEAPAWGVAKTDGTIGSIGVAAKDFYSRLKPYLPTILECNTPNAQVAIWKGRKNELLSYAINGQLSSFADSIEAYVNMLYRNNYNCKIIDDMMLKKGELDGIKLLILPTPYEFDKELALATDAFVRSGGTVLCEAHLGGYDADVNRHSEVMPGCCLNEMWKMKEIETTSAYHIKSNTDSSVDTSALNDDVKKAIDAYGVNGGKYLIIDTHKAQIVGAERFAELSFDFGKTLGSVAEKTCIAELAVGQGKVFYCGSNLGEGASIAPDSFDNFMEYVCMQSGVTKNNIDCPIGIHIDALSENLIVVYNTTYKEQKIYLPAKMKSIFFDKNTKDLVYTLAPQTADILVMIEEEEK